MNNFLLENIRLSLQSIRSQLLRTILTVLIIAVGITALVGILTAIDSIQQSITSNFTSMGANTFTIRNREMSIRIGRKGKKPKTFKAITYDEALRFKEQFDFPVVTSISALASPTGTLKYQSKKTNPNIAVFGGDENYWSSAGYEIAAGRNFSPQEIEYSAHVVILGSEVVKNLFSSNELPLDKIISVGNGKYKVIGVFKEKGTSMGFGGDKIVLIPLNCVRQYFSRPDMSYVINVLSKSPQEMEIAIGEATGLFRKIRKVNLSEEENFEIMKSDAFAAMFIDNIKYVTWAATIIGFITLLGAAIGLMNIMLVSVTERTREIGIRKSMGATQQIIKRQFLIEAVVICQMGGLVGIILGIIIGNITSYIIGAGFIVPWLWIIFGLVLCLLVGLIAGLYPAAKASKLDPVDSLRFE